ncbi:hypothetical protein ACJEQE_31425, partial [Klebsiella pneumoniae]|uniref:hypothetical protein n=1 Tax=Klebsiella pneumoniae TaxID=573 RepID=UPI003871F638
SASWKTDEQMHVGTKLLELLIEGTGLVEMTKNKMADGSDDVTSMQMVQLAPAFVELLSKRAGALAGISPMHQPCVVPPKPWVGTVGGGYWSV